MADQLKTAIENLSNTFDGPIEVIFYYNPKGKEQKLFFMKCERLNFQQETKKE